MARLQHVFVGVIAAGLIATLSAAHAQDSSPEDIAQEWVALANDALWALERGPTIEARTMFHLSIAMYDAWAAYDDTAMGYLTGTRYKQPANARTPENMRETVSHAAYTLLMDRFERFRLWPPDSDPRRAYYAFGDKMEALGYLRKRGDIVASDAQALGTMIGNRVIAFAESDGANENNDYRDWTYEPSNPHLYSGKMGTGGMKHPDLWQPIITPDDDNNADNDQIYLTPHWGTVRAFSLAPAAHGSMRFPVGPLPAYETDRAGYVAMFMEVLRFSSMLDPDVGAGSEMINLSPRVRGADWMMAVAPAKHPPSLRDTPLKGGPHAINPHTQQPYADNFAKLGDYLRAVAANHDGIRYMTPIPWWNEVATNVLAGDGVVGMRAPNKPNAHDLEYDVKLYFALNASLHDTAVAVWELKRAYNSARPISAIRMLAETGDLPIEPGLVERIEAGDPLAGRNGEHVGKLKVFAWAGPNRGVQWMLAEMWHPYQESDEVSPPFPGYVSGHAAFARAAANVLTEYTGDAYFPGGLAELIVTNTRIEDRLEDDLSAPVTLQWATYRDMAAETALGRVLCGVHISADTRAAVPIGESIADTAYALAQSYFNGDAPAMSEAATD